MPIGTIIGIDSFSYTKKETGELRTSTRIHYTYKLTGKDAKGLGADNVNVNVDRFETPLKHGGLYLIEIGQKGFLENLEMLSEPDPDKK